MRRAPRLQLLQVRRALVQLPCILCRRVAINSAMHAWVCACAIVMRHAALGPSLPLPRAPQLQFFMQSTQLTALLPRACHSCLPPSGSFAGWLRPCSARPGRLWHLPPQGLGAHTAPLCIGFRCTLVEPVSYICRRRRRSLVAGLPGRALDLPCMPLSLHVVDPAEAHKRVKCGCVLLLLRLLLRVCASPSKPRVGDEQFFVPGHTCRQPGPWPRNNTPDTGWRCGSHQAGGCQPEVALHAATCIARATCIRRHVMVYGRLAPSAPGRPQRLATVCRPLQGPLKGWR